MKTKILILLLSTYLFLGCNEDDNPFLLPNVTQNGANTAGCYIDDELYVLKNVYYDNAWLGASKTIDLKYEYFESRKIWYVNLYMKFENQNEKEQTMSFKLTSEEKINAQKYKLGKYIEGGSYNSVHLSSKGETDENAGEITLTKIEDNDKCLLISGTFNFEIKDKNTNEIINITEGRFDFKKPKNN